MPSVVTPSLLIQHANHLRRKRSLPALAVTAALVSAALLPATLMAADHQTALAQDGAAQSHFNIAPGSLASVLNRFASTAGITLSFDPSQLAGLNSQGIQGHYIIEDALTQLLTNTGLQAQRTASGAYIVIALPTSNAVTTLPAVTVSGTVLEASTEGSGSYTSNAVTIGKGVQSSRNIAQAVSVLTRQQLDDQGITDIHGALLNAPGITMVSNDPGGHFYSRGFLIESYQFDGVPLERQLYARGSAFNTDMSIYDRVEIMRGPQGLFEGEGGPSGSINLVRKRPTAASQLMLQAKAGSWDRYGGQADVSGALTSSQSVRGRVVVNYEQADSFRDNINSTERTAYAAVDIDLSDATMLGIGFSREKPEGSLDWGGLAGYADGSMPEYSRSTNLGASWGYASKSQDTWYLDVSHSINDTWKLQASLVEVREYNDLKYLLRSGRLGPPNTKRGDAYAFDMFSKNFGGDLHLTGDLSLFERKLSLTAGTNFSRQRSADLWGWIRNYEDLSGDYDRPSISPEPSLADILAANRMDDGYRSEKTGLYSMGRYELSQSLALIAGVRLSSFTQTYSSDGSWGYSASTAKENDKLIPFTGLTYAINNQWSAYGSYAEIFKPQSFRDVSGNFLKPVSGTNYELGLKGELLNGRLNSAFALFRTQQQNVAIEDESIDWELADTLCGGTCYISSAHLRSQGAEAEINGELYPGLQLSASYTYTQTRYRSEQAPAVGYDISASTGVPRHIVRLWSNYRLPGAWRAWTLGAGVRSQSESSDFAYFGRRQGGYTLLDLRLGYEYDQHFSLALNINNLTDKKYFSSISYDNNYYGTPASFLLSLQYKL